MQRAHVVGAGLAGLSAALRLAQAGVGVTLYEAASHAGGRCRSFIDPKLDCVIDNGAHLMLSGNGEVANFLDLTGGASEIITAPRARFDFLNAANNQRWAVDLGDGQGRLSVLLSLLRAHNRPPGVSAWTLFRDLNALKSGQTKTVAACVAGSAAYEPFWHPLTVAVLNAEPDEAAASLLWRVLADTALKGGTFARPLLTRSGLGAALIEPALTTLAGLGVDVRLSTRVQAVECVDGRVASLSLSSGVEVLGTGDLVVLAVPHFAVDDVVEGLSVPAVSRAILNVHYQLPQPSAAPAMTGLINSPAQWVFVRGSIASVTVSAADAWMDLDADAIAQKLWPDVAKVLGAKVLGEDGDVPPNRVIKERRATFAQTLDAQALRPQAATAYANLTLAGDWTATDLPATIEGALKSGRLAAEAALATA